MSHTYAVFDQQLRSEFSLPELVPVASTDASRAGSDPDLVVRDGNVPEGPMALGEERVTVFDESTRLFSIYRSPRGLYWFHDDIGSMRVHDGRYITVSRDDRATDDAVSKFVVGMGLLSALFQQGHLVLHGSAVSVHGRAAVFVGPTGQGKSTLATAFYANGHGILSDDVSPVYSRSDGPVVPPAFPRLTISHEVATALSVAWSPSARATTRDRRSVDIGDRFDAEPRPLAGIYLLTDGADLAIDPVPTLEGPMELMQVSYSLYPDSDRDALDAHLQTCGDVLSTVPVKRLVRPRSLRDLDDVVQLVASDLVS